MAGKSNGRRPSAGSRPSAKSARRPSTAGRKPAARRVQARAGREKDNVYELSEYRDRSERAARKRTYGVAERRSVNAGSQLTGWSIVFFVLFLVYIVSYVFVSLSKEKLPDVAVVYGNIEIPEIYGGVIVRDEKVYTTQDIGTVIYEVLDHERVKKNAVICSVQDPQTVAMIEEKLRSVDENIVDVQGGREDYSKYSSEISNANMLIKNDIDSGAVSFMSMNFSQIYGVKAKIDKNIESRNMKLLNEGSGGMISLMSERDSYLSQLMDAKTIIRTGQSGIVCYSTDGYEELLTLSGLYSLTREQTTGKIEPADNETETGASTVEEDKAVFKIVTSNVWYISSYLPNRDIEGWEENNAQVLYIAHGDYFEPFEVVIDKITKVSDTESNVVFRSHRQMTDFLNLRTLSYKLKNQTEQGFKIPNTAIADKTLLKIPHRYLSETSSANASSTMAVHTFAGDELRIVEVVVHRSDDEYAYVMQETSGLALGDSMLNPLDQGDIGQVSEITSVKGVYITNSGVASFREINTGGIFNSNEMYTVLDRALNSGIRISDRIIADSKQLSQDRIIH